MISDFDIRRDEAMAIKEEYRQIELRKKYGAMCDLKGHDRNPKQNEKVNELQKNLKLMEELQKKKEKSTPNFMKTKAADAGQYSKFYQH
jgi:molybdopterin synthase catalytic subunit